MLDHFHSILNIKTPSPTASLGVAKSLGKGPYFAKKIHYPTMYIKHFHTLLPARSGKNHTHPSLLNNEQVSQAVHHYLTMQEISEVKFQHTFKVTRITKYNHLLHQVTPLKLMCEVNQTCEGNTMTMPLLQPEILQRR